MAYYLLQVFGLPPDTTRCIFLNPELFLFDKVYP